MNNIIGSGGSPSAFWAFVSPFINICLEIVSVPVFGIPLYLYLLNMLVVGTVIGFVMKGSVGIGSMAEKGIEGARSARAESKRKERSQRVGFGPPSNSKKGRRK